MTASAEHTSLTLPHRLCEEAILNTFHGYPHVTYALESQAHVGLFLSHPGQFYMLFRIRYVHLYK